MSQTSPGEFGIAARRVLFSGLLSAIAVILGWLIYFAFLGGWSVLAAALIGALIAGLIHGGEHYVKTAALESRHSGAAEPAHADSHGDHGHRADFMAALRSGAIVVGFVSIACVHLATELTHELLRPCLMSIVTLVPVGMLFGLIFSADKPTELTGPVALFGIPIGGALIGLAAAAVATGAHVLMGEPRDFWSQAGWWTLVGVGLSALGRWGRLTPSRAALGIALSLLLVLSSAWFSRARASTPSGGSGYAFAWVWMLSSRDNALRAPDVPARVWSEASTHLHAHTAAPGHGDHEDAEPSRWGARMARWCGCADPPTPASQPAGERDALKDIRSEPWFVAMNPESAEPHDPKPLFFLRTPPFDSGRVVCDELRRGAQSGLFRSWVVMGLFALGLGFASFVESQSRPADYPSSRTRRNDAVLWAFVALLVLGGGLAIRTTRVPEQGVTIPKDLFVRFARVEAGGRDDAVDSAFAWNVSRDEYVARVCRDIAGHGFNTVWLDRLDYEFLPTWMEASRRAGLRVIAPTRDTPAGGLLAPRMVSIMEASAGIGRPPLHQYAGDETLLGYAAGNADSDNLEVLINDVELRRHGDVGRPTLVDIVDAGNAKARLGPIRPTVAVWNEAPLPPKADETLRRDFLLKREQAYAAARSAGADLWVDCEVPGLVIAHDRQGQPVAQTPGLSPAELRWQAWSALQHGAKGFGFTIRNRPQREGPRMLFDLSRLGREIPSELYAEAAATLRTIGELGPYLAQLDAVEDWGDPAGAPWGASSPVRAREFVHRATHAHFVLFVNGDTEQWQRAALPAHIHGETFMEVRSGQRWSRDEVGRVILDPGGGALLRILGH